MENPAEIEAKGEASSAGGANVDKLARLKKFLQKAATFGRVEIRGISPIPIEERTVKRTINVFTLWWCMNANILP